ncbi:MAG: hypothetical protein UX04_C0011G0004 [Microgenomates group bacterium GW2011_GWF2_45_18]|nr:MAG: hypothetical protein UW18_C0008G0004 [Microgenomates group bacterium GW2011_GWF1_44_10]KKU01340.1 MAG: hypothetical protein UX04_C0011G0004 [Microgenomates group bacterium GW2011_GWF2_45_18]HAU99350.1 hypothetical protein [Candidatus Paceibacterota bacterium]
MPNMKNTSKTSQKSTFPQPIVRAFPDGCTVIRVPMPAVHSTTVLVLVNTGSRYEDLAQAGISHMLEHMVFKGTKTYPTSMALSSTLDAVGAQYNAFTSKEYTGYYVKTESARMSLAIDVLSQMLTAPLLKADDLEREKGVIIEEMNMYKDTPSRHIGDVFEGVLYKGSSLEGDVIGTKKTVRGISASDLSSYMERWYGASNLIVVVAGDDRVVDSASLEDELHQIFSVRKGAPASELKAMRTEDFNASSLSSKVFLLKEKKTDQAHFMMGVRGVSHTDPRHIPLNMLSVLFGDTMSSRLFNEVREKRGLCYYVNSLMDTYHDTGVFGAGAGVDPTRAVEAVEVVRDELFYLLDRVGSRKVTEDELDRAKQWYHGVKVLSLEDSKSQANYYGMKYLLEGQVKTVEEVFAEIDAVTVQDMIDALASILKRDQLTCAMIGSFDAKTQLGLEKIVHAE